MSDWKNEPPYGPGDWIAADDVRRLTRELDELLNGTNAAKQASLCDIVAQVRREGIRSRAGVPPAQAPSTNEILGMVSDFGQWRWSQGVRDGAKGYPPSNVEDGDTLFARIVAAVNALGVEGLDPQTFRPDHE